MEVENNSVCVNCGFNCPSIYKQFSDEIIKLTNCDKCGGLVDKYVETEYSIIIIDMLLLRKEALRHILFNSNLQIIWKLVILFILCDAYEKTASHRLSLNDSLKQKKFINELELNFYLMCVKSFLEYFIFASLVVVVLYHSQFRDAKRFSSKHLFHVIILASYGKLFMLPVLVWSKDDVYCKMLIILFIFLTQVQVIREWEISGVFKAVLLISHSYTMLINTNKALYQVYISVTEDIIFHNLKKLPANK